MQNDPTIEIGGDEPEWARNNQRTDVTILGCFEDEREGLKVRTLIDQHDAGMISRRIEAVTDEDFRFWTQNMAKDRKFTGKAGSVITNYYGAGMKDLMLVGLGKRAQFTCETLRDALTAAFKKAREMGARSVAIEPFNLTGTKVTPFALGETLTCYFGLVSYRLNHQKTANLRFTPAQKMRLKLLPSALESDPASEKEFRAGLRSGRIQAKAVNNARDLGNEPPSQCTPARMGDVASLVAANSKGKISCTLYGEDYLLAEGYQGLLAVNHGSSVPAVLAHLAYVHPEAKKRFAICGKSITFDTGGVQIKSGDGMLMMKFDMCGGATAMAIIEAVARLNLPIELHVIIGAVSNEVDGRSYKPLDIIHTKLGISIEVANTDAEGRVTLAEVFAFAKALKPDVLIDIATLTGAARQTSGDMAACLFSNNDELRDALIAASAATGEMVQPINLFRKQYAALNKSDMGDVSNSGGAPGAITAANFLCDFAEKKPRGSRSKHKQAWAHLDIAPVAARSREVGADPKGATGYGARLVIDYLRSEGSKK